jgi:hypothetical protein
MGILPTPQASMEQIGLLMAGMGGEPAETGSG